MTKPNPVPTMLYQPGTMATSYDISYDYKIVDRTEVKKCLENGWYKHYMHFPKKKKKK